MERSRGDEQDVVGLHGAVLRAHCRAFDDRKEVTLYALPRHVGTANAAVRAHLVDLVQEDDARLFGALHRVALDLVVVDELLGLFLLENLERVGDLEQAPLRAPFEAGHLRHHVLQIHLFGALRAEDSHERVVRVGDIELDLGVVELPVAELLPNVVDLAIGVERLRLLRLLRVDLEAQGTELMGLRALLRLLRLGRWPSRSQDHLGEPLFGGISCARVCTPSRASFSQI